MKLFYGTMSRLNYELRALLFATFVVCACLIAPCSYAQNISEKGWQEAYSRRDYKLGITLSAFKEMPHPDQKEWPNAYPVCSNDKTAALGQRDLNISQAFEDVGIIKCVYYFGLDFPLGAGLMLGDIPSQTEFYFLQPDGMQDYILFWIRTGGPSAKFDSILSSFRTAYGKPESIKSVIWENNIGGKFSNTIVKWQNKVSSIELRHYGETLNVFSLEHVLTPVMKILYQRQAKHDAENAKKL